MPIPSSFKQHIEKGTKFFIDAIFTIPECRDNLVFIEQLTNDEIDKKLKNAWKTSLAHQIPNDKLPDYSLVKEVLSNAIQKDLLSQIQNTLKD